MKFKTAQHGTVTVISLEGNLMGGPDAGTLNNKLHDLIDKGKKQIVLDMKGVKFINSSGLGLLIGSVTTMKNAGGSLKLANTSQKIAALITISKLEPVFERYDSVKAAVASFSG
jgi:anti-sigma B factor antagonist